MRVCDPNIIYLDTLFNAAFGHACSNMRSQIVISVNQDEVTLMYGLDDYVCCLHLEVLWF